MYFLFLLSPVMVTPIRLLEEFIWTFHGLPVCEFSNEMQHGRKGRSLCNNKQCPTNLWHLTTVAQCNKTGQEHNRATMVCINCELQIQIRLTKRRSMVAVFCWFVVELLSTVKHISQQQSNSKLTESAVKFKAHCRFPQDLFWMWPVGWKNEFFDIIISTANWSPTILSADPQSNRVPMLRWQSTPFQNFFRDFFWGIASKTRGRSFANSRQCLVITVKLDRTSFKFKWCPYPSLLIHDRRHIATCNTYSWIELTKHPSHPVP